ncbi:MAG: TIGR01906 family membrane protein [Clostridia bacterium]|nr:TIGR01906 family membrane protein [Clostridia bacterium]
MALTLRAGFYSGFWHDPPEWALRVASEDADELFEAIPRALNGDLDALRLRVRGLDGREVAAFNEREIAHMADVAELYRLAKIVLCVSAALFLTLALWIWQRGRRTPNKAGIAKGALWGVLDVLLLAGAVALWALIDFRSAFWAFHHIAFTNDLWLLDPNTDLLIQMMPQEFFEWTVMAIGLLWATCAVAWCIGWGIVLRRTKSKAEEKA